MSTGFVNSLMDKYRKKYYDSDDDHKSDDSGESDSGSNSAFSIETYNSDNDSLDSDDSEKINKDIVFFKSSYGLKMKNKINDKGEKKINQGCEHYISNCDLIFPCCKKLFRCVRCHDEYYKSKNIDHETNRNIEIIICRYCGNNQEPSNKCTECKKSFGKYVCLKCHIYDFSDKVKYHCDKCKKCRAGYKEDAKHCNTCECCYLVNAFNTHNCKKDKLKHQCCICLDELENYSSLKELHCGHILHSECYNEFIKTSYKCPICSKTIKDMTQEFAQMDIDVNNNVMPPSMQQQVKIGCNDCLEDSTVQNHYVGLKCSTCGSYNTYKK